LAYKDDISLLGDDIRKIEKIADVLLGLNSYRDVGLGVNIKIKIKIKSVAYSSQGSHTGQLDFCN
jgi:hypothetical protein